MNVIPLKTHGSEGLEASAKKATCNPEVASNKNALVLYTPNGNHLIQVCRAQGMPLQNALTNKFSGICSNLAPTYEESLDSAPATIEKIEALRKFYNQKAHPTRSLPPCVYVRIDLRKLLTREELFKLPSSQIEPLARRLLVKANEPCPRERLFWRPEHLEWSKKWNNGVPSVQDTPLEKDMVLMAIIPRKESKDYELYDPAARDLVGCSNLFGRVLGYTRNEAQLFQFSAPSFSGKKAMSLIWNFMAMSQIDSIFFTDVSTILKGEDCDEADCEGALTSLHDSEVFKTGESWYCRQGATPYISKLIFRDLFGIEFIYNRFESALRGKNKDKRLTRTPDYDKFADVCLTLYLESHTSNEAYKQARHFLHHIKVNDLCSGTSKLASFYPKLGELSVFLKNSRERLGSPETVGKLLAIAMERGHRSVQDVPYDQISEVSHDESFYEIHKLMHDLRDRIVSNKDSVFFQYISDTLKRSTGRVSPTLCVFAFLVLDRFLKKLKGLSDPAMSSFLNVPKRDVLPETRPDTPRAQKQANKAQAKVKITNVIYNILEPKVDDVDGIKNVTKKVCQAFLRMIENRPGSPVSAKICRNSNQYNREKWQEYSEETGAKDDLLATQTAVQYIASLPLNELAFVYPELVSAWESRYPMLKNNTWRFTVADLIDALQLDEAGADELFDDLFRGAMKHVSHLSLPLFKNYAASPQKDTKSAYELFMISKYLCKRAELFALYLPEAFRKIKKG